MPESDEERQREQNVGSCVILRGPRITSWVVWLTITLGLTFFCIHSLTALLRTLEKCKLLWRGSKRKVNPAYSGKTLRR
jgi:hypothetical protein